jgi:hypothetical protein
MSLFAQSVEFVDVIISILFQVFTINILEFDIFDFNLVVLIPIFFKSPDIFQIFDLFINMVEVSRRCIADSKELKAEDHIVPSCSEAFHNIIILIEKVEGIFVCVRGLERSILLEVDF